jgi:hypothetical protein
MIFKSYQLAAMAVAAAASLASAQAETRSERDSVRRAVQAFYSWYTPRAAKPRGVDMVMRAATHGPLSFDPELVKWLRIDSTARARTKDEVNGLDGDPYFNAQDPCDRYRVQSVRSQDSRFLVDVVGQGGCTAHKNPDVIVVVGRTGGKWVVKEFLDPSRRNEGLLPLLRRLHPKAG